MNDHLGKPFDIDQLVSTILRWTSPAVGGDFGSGSEPATDVALLDLAGAIDRLDGDRDFLDSLLDRFVARLPDWHQQLERALLAGDSEDARQIAHSLKGSAATIGATEVSAAAASIEDRLRTSLDLQVTDPLVVVLSTSVARTIEALSLRNTRWGDRHD